MTSKSDAESPFTHLGDGAPVSLGRDRPDVPDIPKSCWPPCQVCKDNPVVERVRFLKPQSWRDEDILTIEMVCHGMRSTGIVTKRELVIAVEDKKQAEVFINRLLEMAEFVGSAHPSVLVVAADTKEEPKEPESLKRDDAPWNF